MALILLLLVLLLLSVIIVKTTNQEIDRNWFKHVVNNMVSLVVAYIVDIPV